MPLDVDHLKRFHDTFGHAAGTSCSPPSAKLLGSSFQGKPLGPITASIGVAAVVEPLEAV
jgi:hypothetical protein